MLDSPRGPGRPEADECQPYYSNYISLVPEGHVVAGHELHHLADIRRQHGAQPPAAAGPAGKDSPMLFMVIERYKNRDALGVYRRFREQGRMAPEGLTYVGSWIEANFDRCFQLMECADPRLFQEWVVRWQDLIEFEFIPVVPSKDTAETVAPLL